MTRSSTTIVVLAVSALLGLAGSTPASSQTPAKAARGEASATKSAAVARPRWSDLKPVQREALAPLQGKWDGYDADRKQKWLEVASRYPNLSPEGKQRLHERMAEFAQLTPQQRQTLRENFRKAYELPADQRQAVLQQYKGLPPDQREALTEQAGRKEEPPRRTPRDLPATTTFDRKVEPVSR
jgi:hypothetical protein